MSTLSGVWGAGAPIPGSAVAPMLARPSRTRRTRAARVTRERAGAARHLAGHRGALEQRLAEQLRLTRAAASRSTARADARAAARLGRGVEQNRRDVHAGDPIHERVVGLGDQREATARHAVHQPDLPQRLGAIQALGEEPPRQALERRLVFGLGQRRVADVVAEIEVGVVRPHRPALAEGHVHKSLAIARHQVQAAEDVIHELLRASAPCPRRPSPRRRACVRSSRPPGAGRRCREPSGDRGWPSLDSRRSSFTWEGLASPSSPGRGPIGRRRVRLAARTVRLATRWRSPPGA